jgi:hypothetical protein
MVHHFSAAAQLAHKDVVAQALRRAQFGLGFSEFDSKGWACIRHQCFRLVSGLIPQVPGEWQHRPKRSHVNLS